jgi:solute carrier family 34 (sodium-dependent phosphate cotransporter)
MRSSRHVAYSYYPGRQAMDPHRDPTPSPLSRITGTGPGPYHHVPMPEAEVGGVGRRWWERLVLGLLGIGLFVTALGLMKQGAASLIPTLEGSIFTDNAWSALGVGWLGACIVLSGSPVAASALTLLDGGAIDRSESFAMLTGSRLGASFVVLVVGVIYALRRDAGRKAPLSIGVYALTITAVAYLPGAAFGWWLLTRGHLDGIDLAASPGVVSVTDELFGWLPDLLEDIVPGWALFPIGVVILLGAFACIDRVLPTVGSDRFSASRLTNPWVMFGLGCLVAFLTLSVSVALTLLVPLVANGYLKREDTIPYIAGANITTLADTLVAAVILGNPDAVRVVLAEVIGVSTVTIALLALAYPLVRRGSIAWARFTLTSRSHLAGFVVLLFTTPILLILY